MVASNGKDFAGQRHLCLKMKHLCRFCECPVAEGGVLLSEVDQEALSRWWSACLHTELDSETLDGAWSCRLCVSDARLWHENSSGQMGADFVWWPLNDQFYKFYEEHQLKNLCMELTNLSESDFEDLEVKVEKISCELCDEKFFVQANLKFHIEETHQGETEDKPLECLFCSKLIRGKPHLQDHLKLSHKDQGAWCKFKRCSAVFETEKFLKDHLEKSHLVKKGDNPIECKKCKSWFANDVNLASHVKTIHSKKKLVTSKNITNCLFCTKSFTNENDLYKHTKENHQKEAIKCRHIGCRHYFKTKKQMQEHFVDKHRKNCKFCHATFSNHPLLMSHLKKVHLDKRCEFSTCAFYTDSKQEMEKHRKENHVSKKAEPCECVYCGKPFGTVRNRACHVRRIHPHIAIKCNLVKCLHFVKSIADLEEHKKEAHQRKEKRRRSEVCLYCQKTMLDRHNYARHVQRCHSQEAVKCKYRNCFAFFKSQVELRKHYEKKHPEKYCCALCDYKAPKKEYLREHFVHHHFPKDKKCPHCPIFVSGSSSLRDHVKSKHKETETCPHCREKSTKLVCHLGTALCPLCSQPFPCKKLFADHKKVCKKVYECRECGVQFGMEVHFRCHVNEKHRAPGQKWKGLKCIKCKRFFPSRESLRSHQLSEHPSMVVKCDLCGEKLLSRDNVDRHKFLVHGVGGFECKECDKHFVVKRQFEEHVKWNHGKNNPRRQFVECADCGRIMKKSSFQGHFIQQHL